jgi:hypothetical protein
MVETVLRSRRRRSEGKVTLAAERYAAMGWPVCPGAYPPGRSQAGRGCSCDRLGCPAPGAHPVSPAWQIEASADSELVSRWWLAAPEANVILVTGRVFDVLDVPARAGMTALARMDRSGVRPGPVALSAGRRALFFVSTRGRPADEDEWWSCHLDSEPEAVEQVAGLRWHCRDSYVLAPPSRFGGGQTARWLRGPHGGTQGGRRGESLPDGLRLLEYLADACEAAG